MGFFLRCIVFGGLGTRELRVLGFRVFGLGFRVSFLGLIREGFLNPRVRDFATAAVSLSDRAVLPRGSTYTTIMEVGPQNHNGDGFFGD